MKKYQLMFIAAIFSLLLTGTPFAASGLTGHHPSTSIKHIHSAQSQKNNKQPKKVKEGSIGGIMGPDGPEPCAGYSC